MSRILIKQTLDNIDKEVTLAGHVATKRDHGKVTFIDLRDESGSLQIVGYKMLGELKMESVISVTGMVKKRPTGQINPHLITGELELEVKSYTLLSAAKDLPILVNDEEP